MSHSQKNSLYKAHIKQWWLPSLLEHMQAIIFHVLPLRSKLIEWNKICTLKFRKMESYWKRAAQSINSKRHYNLQLSRTKSIGSYFPEKIDANVESKIFHKKMFALFGEKCLEDDYSSLHVEVIQKQLIFFHKTTFVQTHFGVCSVQKKWWRFISSFWTQIANVAIYVQVSFQTWKYYFFYYTMILLIHFQTFRVRYAIFMITVLLSLQFDGWYNIFILFVIH